MGLGLSRDGDGGLASTVVLRDVEVDWPVSEMCVNDGVGIWLAFTAGVTVAAVDGRPFS